MPFSVFWLYAYRVVIIAIGAACANKQNFRISRRAQFFKYISRQNLDVNPVARLISPHEKINNATCHINSPCLLTAVS